MATRRDLLKGMFATVALSVALPYLPLQAAIAIEETVHLPEPNNVPGEIWLKQDGVWKFVGMLSEVTYQEAEVHRQQDNSYGYLRHLSFQQRKGPDTVSLSMKTDAEGTNLIRGAMEEMLGSSDILSLPPKSMYFDIRTVVKVKDELFALSFSELMLTDLSISMNLTSKSEVFDVTTRFIATSFNYTRLV